MSAIGNRAHDELMSDQCRRAFAEEWNRPLDAAAVEEEARRRWAEREASDALSRWLAATSWEEIACNLLEYHLREAGLDDRSAPWMGRRRPPWWARTD